MEKFAVKGIILNDDDKFLLLKRSKKETSDIEKWDLPGGRLDSGEKLIDGLVREVKEETKLIIIVENLCSTWNYKPTENFEIKGFTYFCKYVSGKVKLSKEHSAYKWISISEIEEFSINENLKLELIKVFETNGKISLRDRLRYIKFSYFNIR